MLIMCQLEFRDKEVVWREVHLHSFNWHLMVGGGRCGVVYGDNLDPWRAEVIQISGWRAAG